MEKSEFEKRIAEKAEKRFEDEFATLVRYIYSHPIGKYLKVKMGEEEITLANFGGNYGLMNESNLANKNSRLTNLAAIKEDALKQYRQEEVDGILARLENFKYLFDQT